MIVHSVLSPVVLIPNRGCVGSTGCQFVFRVWENRPGLSVADHLWFAASRSNRAIVTAIPRLVKSAFTIGVEWNARNTAPTDSATTAIRTAFLPDMVRPNEQVRDKRRENILASGRGQLC